MPEAACCGDYCGKCPHFPHNCSGCMTGERVDCFFIRCCQKHGIRHCGLCAEFPCATLKNFIPDDRPGCPSGFHLENLRIRAERGDEAWLAMQREKWNTVQQNPNDAQMV